MSPFREISSANRGENLRFLLYSHDGFGLGHLRRSLTIADALLESEPDASALLITGSPTPALFAAHDRCEIVKLPSITKEVDGRYRARTGRLDVDSTLELRSSLIKTIAEQFRPDVFLVDHTATGPGRELLPALRALSASQTRIVLGLRDVLDESKRAKRELRDSGAIDALRTYYDAIFVYGDRRVVDPLELYEMPADLRAKASFCGIVSNRSSRYSPTPRAPREAGARPRIVASAGGGEDGYALIRGVVAALRGPLRDEAIDAQLIAGPHCSETRLADLERACQDDPRIVLRRHVKSMDALLESADVLLTMGGYNSIYEAIRAGRSVLALPRSFPRREQLLRCERLEALGLVETLAANAAIDPQIMAAAIRRELARGEVRHLRVQLDFDGAERAASSLAALARGSREATSYVDG